MNDFDFYETGKDINKYSNPSVVQKRAFKLLGEEARIVISPRATKKYRIVNPETNKYVDFGYYGMQDYTKHKDEERRVRFQQRNQRFRNAPKYSAGWCSYYLLW